MARCPTCGNTFDENSSPAMPFCSSRCRQIDLARWYDERISLPIRRYDEDEESELPEGWNDVEEN
jgi:endogenous inhibitor of DNA gyrase (YacG/DUF329 family)